MTARKRRRAAGFTLIEVVVALAIVVIAMAALMSVLSSSAGTVVYLRDKTFAQWVAENQIATTRLTAQSQNQAPQTGDSTGEVDFAGRSWHWQQSISAAELPGMVRIDVSVRPADVKADDKHGWYTTVTGMYSDALGQARGDMPAWGTGTGLTAAQGGLGGGGFQMDGGSSSSSSSSSSSDPFFTSSPASSSSASSSSSGSASSSPGGLQ
jgi:general secretion pathway protein I